jgi:hypothetical protein
MQVIVKYTEISGGTNSFIIMDTSDGSPGLKTECCLARLNVVDRVCTLDEGLSGYDTESHYLQLFVGCLICAVCICLAYGGVRHMMCCVLFYFTWNIVHY